MTRTPNRTRIWKVGVAVWIVSLVVFPAVAIYGGQTAATVDVALLFGSALVVSVLCYGVVHIGAMLASALAVATLVGFAVRPLHLPVWAFPVLAVAGTWAWGTTQRRHRAQTTH